MNNLDEAEIRRAMRAQLQAAVEAEREACADTCFNPKWPLKTSTDHIQARTAGIIRARGNTDALEAAKAEARAEALRDAAEMATYCLANPEGENLEDRQYAIEYRILALIPTNGDLK